MKNSSLFLVSFIAFLLAWGCSEEQVVPRTNPQIVMSAVEIEGTIGVKFSATVQDFGSDQIIEHGFIYAQTTNFEYGETEGPKIGSSEQIAFLGAPSDSFSEIAKAGLQGGRRYAVRAYLKTAEYTVYSSPLSFTSQSTAGFQFERLQYSEPLYFGDTVTVFGKNLSNQISNYAVSVNGQAVTVFDLQKESFRFLLPSMLSFSAPYQSSAYLEFSFEIAGKSLGIIEEVKFREPEFSINSVPQNYGPRLEIKGKYMRSDASYVIARLANGEIRTLDAVYTDSVIFFQSKVAFESLNPKLSVVVRGKTYDLENAVRLNPTELEPNQSIRVKLGNTITLKGVNFNSEIPEANEIILDEGGLYFQPISVTKDTYSFQLNYKEHPYGRQIQVRSKVAGKVSNNSAEVFLTDPGIPIMSYSGVQLTYGEPSIVTIGDFVYQRDGRRVFRIDPKNRKVTQLFTLPVTGYDNFVNYYLLTDGQKLFLYDDYYSYANEGGILTVIDPNTGDKQVFPSMPFLVEQPEAMYAQDGAFYIEGGFVRGEFDVTYSKNRYKLDLSTRQWVQLPGEFKGFREVSKPYSIFDFQGKKYAFSNEMVANQERLVLKSFNPSTEGWTTEKTYLENYQVLRFPSVAVGDFVFPQFKQNHDLRIRWGTDSFEKWDRGVGQFNFLEGFTFGFNDMFYQIGIQLIWEFDQSYF